MQKISVQNIIIINNIQPYLYAWKQHIFGRYIKDVDNVFYGGDAAVADDDINYYGKKKLKLILLVTKSNLE